MNAYFAYIRVSTAKQGEHGASLPEQRDAITAFAARNGLSISVWFEERETAAKIGRHEFSRMVAALKKKAATGVIFHKIDRSARNLKDWSTVQDLAENGIDVRFAHESVNLRSNEGKLTGDFLAVISAHYIRNLRDEVKKGIRGRLKQGLYPLAAPLGYLDQGGGKPKIPDPTRAPLIHDAFELYASGMSLVPLSDELHRRGLRGRNGNRLSISRLAELLRNPFYIGIIRMKTRNEHYTGIHRPIIPKVLFDRVQHVIDGKANAKVTVHDFLFRRLITCAACQYRLIGERQKGHVYYRCHTRGCPTCSIREEAAEHALQSRFQPLSLKEDELQELHEMNTQLETEWNGKRTGYEKALALQIEHLDIRMSRLMDAYLDNAIDRTLFEEKKLSLLMDRKALDEQRTLLSSGEYSPARQVSEYLELVKTLPLSYRIADVQGRREIIKTVTSNLFANENGLVVELHSPFQEISNFTSFPTGEPLRNEPRTRARKIFDFLIEYFTARAKDAQQRDRSLAA
jgi:DNA invertase Pin-like site-specific DNA recombinase